MARAGSLRCWPRSRRRLGPRGVDPVRGRRSNRLARRRPRLPRRGLTAPCARCSATARCARGGGRKREIALTFDDGPGRTRPASCRAQPARGQGDVLRDRSEEGPFTRPRWPSSGRGHVIGDHTENHPHLASLSAGDQREELLAPINGCRATASRARAFAALRLLRQHDDRAAAAARHADGAVERRLARLRPARASSRSSIASSPRRSQARYRVLMHDGGGDRSQTIAAIPRIVTQLRRSTIAS